MNRLITADNSCRANSAIGLHAADTLIQPPPDVAHACRRLRISAPPPPSTNQQWLEDAVMNAAKAQPLMNPEELFARYIEQADFPCLAAKTAVARDRVTYFHGTSLNCAEHDRALLQALRAFAEPMQEDVPFRSFIALFPATPDMAPHVFEQALWRRLQGLHDLDARECAWDEAVSSDPESPNFSMSLGGHAFYVVGVHPGSMRLARRFPLTALVLNLHRQFEQLREQERYHRFSEAIIERDVTLQGYPNPMLNEHGSSSEAPQYSGREVDADWVCPFKPKT